MKIHQSDLYYTLPQRNAMKITTKARYAIMSMVDLAVEASREKPVSVHEISTRLDIKVNFLEQILVKLKSNKLLESVKGPGGGYYLASSPSMIRISDIINVVERPTKFTRCDKHEKGCLKNKSIRCLTHHFWAGLDNRINEYFSTTTIADICEGKNDRT